MEELSPERVGRGWCLREDTEAVARLCVEEDVNFAKECSALIDLELPAQGRVAVEADASEVQPAVLRLTAQLDFELTRRPESDVALGATRGNIDSQHHLRVDAVADGHVEVTALVCL